MISLKTCLRRGGHQWLPKITANYPRTFTVRRIKKVSDHGYRSCNRDKERIETFKPEKKNAIAVQNPRYCTVRGVVLLRWALMCHCKLKREEDANQKSETKYPDVFLKIHSFNCSLPYELIIITCLIFFSSALSKEKKNWEKERIKLIWKQWIIFYV